MSAAANLPVRAADAAAGRGESGGRRGFAGYLLLLPGALWLLLFFVVPTVTLVATSLYDPSGSLQTGYAMTGHWQNYVDATRDYLPQIVRSFVYAITATVVCIILGYPLAYAIAFKAGRWKNLMLVAVIAPFFTSFLVRTLSWQYLLGDNEALVSILRSLHVLGPDGHLLATPFAVVTGLSYNFLPFMVLPLVRVAGEGRPPADRGRRRPVRRTVHGVPQDHAAAVHARPGRRHAADVHPRRR